MSRKNREKRSSASFAVKILAVLSLLTLVCGVIGAGIYSAQKDSQALSANLGIQSAAKVPLETLTESFSSTATKASQASATPSVRFDLSQNKLAQIIPNTAHVQQIT